MPLDRRRSIAAEDGGDTCRICRGEGTLDQPLFYPCKCSGSIKFVHQDCLMEWLSHSQKKYCELCKTPFRFTKLYDQSMPANLPFFLFLRQVVYHGTKTLGRWLRYTMVTLIWLCWLPWSIRQVWRGLFWLADGSWMTAQELRQSLAAETGLNLENATSAQVSDALSNISGIENIFMGFPIMYLDPVGDLFNLLSGGRLVGGLVRLLSYAWYGTEDNPAFNGPSDTASSLEHVGRQPSLLSGIKSISSLTRFELLNDGLVDVLEGQLICLSVIAAFILVFLIREWVINQQPILNMPDADQADVPIPPPPANDEQRHMARRRRRGLRMLQDQNGQLENGALDVAQRPIAMPRPRRAVTDNNIALPPPTEPEAFARPDFPPRAASLVPVPQEMEEAAQQLPSFDFRALQHIESLDLHSPPLQRGAFDELGQIRRNLDEGSITEFPWVNEPLHTVKEVVEVVANVRDSSVRPTDFVENDLPPTEGSASQSLFNRPPESTDITSASPTSSSNQGMPTSHQYNSPDRYSSQFQALMDETDAASSDDAVVPTPPSGAASEIEHHLEPDQDADTLPNPVEPATPNPPPEYEVQTFWDKVAFWLWQTPEFVPQDPRLLDVDDQELVGNVDGVQPFVPVRNPEEPAAIVNQHPAPINPQPNIQFGVDLNDPNAVDDAEDLEGILELVGMEGPIAGMMQNIIFSVFLITLTLSASIWCPYIWGKIALLCFANPVGVFIRAPLYLLSKSADTLIDLLLFTVGVLGLVIDYSVQIIKALSKPILPAFSDLLGTSLIEDLSLTLSQNSGTRLEKAFTGTFFGMRPDLPTFSMQSHHALRVFKKAFSEATQAFLDELDLSKSFSSTWSLRGIFSLPVVVGNEILQLPQEIWSKGNAISAWFTALSVELKPISFAKASAIDYTLVEWSTKDKIIAVMLGYSFFALAGFLYLKIARLFYNLQEDEKVEGVLADSLRQAGGVMKVIVIIGIEMIIFPLYCGVMLDFALLPLFQNASMTTRFIFMFNAPITALFVHWFIGTCYMFHFALFVSMCRKIMRKGVLYFIRDPDDPSFHPVRDVLERPVATQLGKIAFSALIYGGLVIVCLGGVVFVLSVAGNVLPIQWTTDEPRLAFPIDIIFYNFMLPFIIRKANVSKKISSMYEWWFRGCAGVLRLTHFLFGQERAEEKVPLQRSWSGIVRNFSGANDGSAAVKHEGQAETTSQSGFAEGVNPITQSPAIDEANSTDSIDQTHHEERATVEGSYVRVPATDSVRIPKGTLVFLEVDEDNNRLDGQPDHEKGMHGKSDERFMKIYLPPHFKARIATFITFVWLFAASTGVVFTVGPLLLGRRIIKLLSGTKAPPNDLYAFTVGIHICGILAYGLFHALQQRKELKSKTINWFASGHRILPHLLATIQYVLGLAYLGLAFGVILPFAISFLCELYIHMPIYTYLVSKYNITTKAETASASTSTTAIIPTIYILQTWTLGLLYIRLIIRILTTYPRPNSLAATAIRAIIQAPHGLLDPNVRLATRALVLPLTVLISILTIFPPSYAHFAIWLLDIHDPSLRTQFYRLSYPTIMAIFVAVYAALKFHQRIQGWRVRVRDDVYLIGERLHNFSDDETRRRLAAAKNGKEKATDQMDLVEKSEETTSVPPSSTDVPEDIKGKGKAVSSPDEDSDAADVDDGYEGGPSGSVDMDSRDLNEGLHGLRDGMHIGVGGSSSSM